MSKINYTELCKDFIYNFNKNYEIDERFRCSKCKTDKYVSFDLCHTEVGSPYDIAYCEKCNQRVWEEDIN